MAEALSLKVDIGVFQKTMEKLDSILDELGKKQESLQTNVDRLGSDDFRGSDVQSAIELAQKQMTYVQNSINKVRAQRNIIERALQARETNASTLQTDISSIDEALPDIFANS